MILFKFTHIGIAAFAALISISPALAYDEKKGAELLEGGWQSLATGETWVFDITHGKWQQFVGARQFDADFKLVAMPANLIKITSSSGRNYIVHFSPENTLIRVFLEGVEDVPLLMERTKSH